MTETLTLKGEAREVAVSEAQAVRALANDGAMRARLAELALLRDGDTVDAEAAELLESVLELGLQSGRIRAVYGPGGEQAATTTLRRLPRGRERTDSCIAVSEALAALQGKQLETIAIRPVAPGAFVLELAVGGLQASVRLDRQGARLASIGT